MNSMLKHTISLGALKRVYFLGIGGIGMSALARFLKVKGIYVAGYDRTATQLTDKMMQEGISIHFEEDVRMIPDGIDLVVYTPAVPAENKEFVFLKNSQLPMIKRAELLGLITHNKRVIAVAGTHGKTTVSSMLANIFSCCPKKCNAILGGISKSINSNYIYSPDSDIFIVEADEFDRSFMQLKPWIAIITSADADHLDIYGDHESLKNAFAEFTGNIKKGGKMIIHKNAGVKVKVDETVDIYSYSIHEPADFQITDIRTSEQNSSFTTKSPFIKTAEYVLGIPGIMNVENALAALAGATTAGVKANHIYDGLYSFAGVNRRFDHRIKSENFVYIDDYAHHPREIDSCIESVRKIYPGRKITGVFQPHLFSRTRDFAQEFATSLQALDRIVLLDIYPARELPIEGVTSSMLLEMIDHSEKFLCSKENLVDFLLKSKPQVLLTLGAGDIDRLVDPIENAFKLSTR